ncbi:MAG: hypothetical protein OXI96_03455 [Acidimicrobiaceae bacterium]|nr:hypothetical protein [Acidimicrobiaceae bacterium]
MIELDDLIVLLLGAPTKNLAIKNRLQGITRLEKLVFLLEHETNLVDILDERSNFRPYNFGPFSEEIYKSVGYLSAYGLLNDTSSLSNNMDDAWENLNEIGDGHPDPYATRNFQLTKLGLEYYESLAEDVEQRGSYIEELSAFKDRFAALTLRQLVRYVYTHYPQMTTQSQIRDQVMHQ